jgi:uncharacterized protein (DUF433 family)
MNAFDAIDMHPEIQDGEPVFSGTRVRIETFCDFMRIGVSVREFLQEFPSVTPDQVRDVCQLVGQQYSVERVKVLMQHTRMVSQSSGVTLGARG